MHDTHAQAYTFAVLEPWIIQHWLDCMQFFLY